MKKSINRNYLKSILFLALVTLIGGFLRFYEVTSNPVSLNTDEVAFAYNAYSILKTGRDEWGKFMPLTFRSVGDYKNPVPTYLLVPSIFTFGLNEFGVRFPFALIGTLAIPIFYFISLYLFNNQLTAKLTAILTTFSPWLIFYSRFGSDQQMAMVIASLGLLLFLIMLKKSLKYAVFAAIFLTLSMYTYYVERVFIPTIIIILTIIYFTNLRKIPKKTVIFLLTAALLVIPLIYSTLFGQDLARGSMVFIGRDIDYLRYVILDHQSPGLIIGNFNFEEFMALVFLIGKRYLNYLQPDFLFFNGLNMTREGSLGLGVLYLFEFPWLILGIIEIVKNKNKEKWLIVGWLALAFLPAAFTNNEQNPSRTIIALPMLLIIIASGLTKFLAILSKIKPSFFKLGIYTFYGMFIVISLIHAFLVFAIHFPMDRSEFSMKGNKEAVEYILAHYDKYSEIVFDPFRGVEAPTTYSLPSHYILFYSKYDPATYQIEVQKNEATGKSGFGKYTIRKIYWPADGSKKGVLFIGSPWSVPMKDIKEEEILKKIYLSDGQLALLIVSPKPN